MDYWSPKHVQLLNVMNKINYQILCILLDYIYIVYFSVYRSSLFDLFLKSLDCFHSSKTTRLKISWILYFSPIRNIQSATFLRNILN